MVRVHLDGRAVVAIRLLGDASVRRLVLGLLGVFELDVPLDGCESTILVVAGVFGPFDPLASDVAIVAMVG